LKLPISSGVLAVVT